jgi:hypothetical protein
MGTSTKSKKKQNKSLLNILDRSTTCRFVYQTICYILYQMNLLNNEHDKYLYHQEFPNLCIKQYPK